MGVLPTTANTVEVNTALIFYLSLAAVLIFCCGVCVAFCIFRKFHLQKLEIIRQLRQERQQQHLAEEETPSKGLESVLKTNEKDVDFYGTAEKPAKGNTSLDMLTVQKHMFRKMNKKEKGAKAGISMVDLDYEPEPTIEAPTPKKILPKPTLKGAIG